MTPVNKLSRFFLIIFIINIIFGCDFGREQIDLNKTIPTGEQSESYTGEPIRIAVGAMITPKEGFSFYKKFLDYIEEKLNRPVKYIDKESYEEINHLLEKKEIDVAFVCSGPYVDGVRKFGLKPLAAPQAYGESVYYSYVIVPIDSSAKKFTDLKGKNFAFTDPQSNTGTLVPTYMLAKMGDTPDSFFNQFEYTYAHDKSITAVALKLVDGATVDSLIWEYADKKNPTHTSKTKIIHKSPPYGIPPVVVRPGLNPDLVNELRRIFLNAHKDPRGREILAGMMIEKFNLLDDKKYDSIREMKDWLSEKNSETK